MTSRCAAVCLLVVVGIGMAVGCDSSDESASGSNADVDTGDSRTSCPASCCCPDIFDGAVAQGPCPAGFIFYCDDCPFQTACRKHDASPPSEVGETETDASSEFDADVDAASRTDGDDADGDR